MTGDPRWRARAREVLYNYTTTRELLKKGEEEIIHGHGQPRDHRYRRFGVSNPTQIKALLLDTAERRKMLAQVRAVERLIMALRTDGRRHRIKALQLLDLVYIRHTHSVYYASLALDVSERTAKRLNSVLLSFVAREMGWLTPEEAERFDAPPAEGSPAARSSRTEPAHKAQPGGKS